MKKINKIYTINILFIIFIISSTINIGCVKENDFYEVGRQPVLLKFPVADTTLSMNRNKLDSLYRFNWETKRNFIEFNLLISKEKDKINETVKIPTGIKKDFYITGYELDEILADLGFELGQTATIYWSVEVKNPDAGWCDEVRMLKVVR